MFCGLPPDFVAITGFLLFVIVIFYEHCCKGRIICVSQSMRVRMMTFGFFKFEMGFASEVEVYCSP